MELESYRIKHTDKAEKAVVNREADQKALKPSKWEYIVPLLAIASLIVACIIISPKKYFWNDELYTYFFTSDPSFVGMLAAFHDKINNTPLLYFLLGWIWDKGFGSSELSLRLFSSIGMGVALIVTWVTLRRTFNFTATLIGVLAVFCTSEIILLQNAEARMYGLFLALSAFSFYFYDLINRVNGVSMRLLLLNAGIHACLIHTHLFGGFYSGAILLSFILTDKLFNRFRIKLYLSIVFSWLTIVLYLPTFFIQADAGKPRTWIPRPVVPDLLDMLNIQAASFFQLGVLVLLLILAALHFFQKEHHKPELKDAAIPKANSSSEVALLILSAALILMPVFIWLFSRTFKPIFYDRYMIPSALGWVTLITYVSYKVITTPRDFNFRFNLGMAPVRLGLLVTIISLLYFPIHSARKFKIQAHPDLFITDGHDDLPIVIVPSGTFLQVNHYSSEPEKYYFILDWETAIDENSGLFTPQEYKHLNAFKHNYPERFKNHILYLKDFLAQHDRFLIADYPDYTRRCPLEPKGGMATARAWVDLHCPQWLEMRLLNNSAYKVTFLNDSDWHSMLLVEKVPK